MATNRNRGVADALAAQRRVAAGTGTIDVGGRLDTGVNTGGPPTKTR